VAWIEVSGGVFDVSVIGEHAFVAAGQGGVWVLDVSDPEVPRAVGWRDTAGRARSIVVDGGRAYVADGPGGLLVLQTSRSGPPESTQGQSGKRPSNGPQIASFSVVPAEVEPGDVVALSWEAKGYQATICPSARYSLFTQDDCWPVPLSGTTTFTIPVQAGGNRTIDLRLTVAAEGAAESAVWQISVAFKCHASWFFSGERPAGICPLEPIESHAAMQRFERGTMIWVKRIGRYIILDEALLDEEGLWRRVAYAQDPLEIADDTSAWVAAPDGLYAPTSGFGLVWRGDVVGLPGYRETLGWALAPEFGYETIWQCDDALPSGGRSWQTCALQGPEGEVIVLDPLYRWRLWDE